MGGEDVGQIPMRSRKPYHQAMPFLQDLGSDVNKVAAKELPVPAHDLRRQSDLRDPLTEIPGQSGDLEPCRVTHNSIGDDSKSVAGVEKLGGSVKGRHLCSLFGIAGSACAAGGEACGRFHRRLRLDPHRPDSGFHSGARLSRRYVAFADGHRPGDKTDAARCLGRLQKPGAGGARVRAASKSHGCHRDRYGLACASWFGGVAAMGVTTKRAGKLGLN